MSPQQDQSPGLHLPQPSFDVGQATAGVPGQYQQSAPMPSIGPSVSPVPMTQAHPYAQTSGMPAMSPSMPPAAPQQAQPAGAISVPPAEVPRQPFGATPTSMPDAAAVQAADDESSVDQEWITKARDVVAKTHSDPYLLSQEISKIKAQYIKVRYNKDIKTGDE